MISKGGVRCIAGPVFVQAESLPLLALILVTTNEPGNQDKDLDHSIEMTYMRYTYAAHVSFEASTALCLM